MICSSENEYQMALVMSRASPLCLKFLCYQNELVSKQQKNVKYRLNNVLMCSPYNSALVQYWGYLKLPDLIVLTNGYRVCWKFFILNSILDIPKVNILTKVKILTFKFVLPFFWKLWQGKHTILYQPPFPLHDSIDQPIICSSLSSILILFF